MQVLLTTLNAKYIHLNLAIRLLYELNKERPGLAWKEFTIKENQDLVADYCAQYDVVAFSCYIWNITQTLAVAQKIKERNPQTKILLGGPEVSYEWEEVIAMPQVDYIIVGEGEIPFASFLEAYPKHLEAVPSLIRKENGQIVQDKQTTTFPMDSYRGLRPYGNEPAADLGNKVAYIETSRGCPYKCEFCLASLDNKVRYLPMETLKENLLYLMQHGRVIKFLDRTFNMKRDFTLEIFEFILANYRPGNVFQFEITADILHPDIIKFIDERVPRGLFRFEIGIQTVNQRANLEVSRKQNFEKTKRIIRQIEHKVELHLDLIVGMALDYWEDIKYSFEEVFKLFAPELQLGFLKFLKGTPVRQKYKEHDFVFDPNPPYQIIESKYLSRAELHQIELLEHALELYWNKKRAPYVLRYVTERYGSFDFLRGLGWYFAERYSLHQYGLQDVFDALWGYVGECYGEDRVLRQLVAVDYYLYSKTKPRVQYWEEVEEPRRRGMVEAWGLHHQKYRYVLLELDFDFVRFAQAGELSLVPSVLVVQYDGREKPRYWAGLADVLKVEGV
jgi:radical SAM superfamily enzyme YgiQ (UPF0313 family)